jgi:DNA-directed RNA polymerase subunit RPC12/RpoP
MNTIKMSAASTFDSKPEIAPAANYEGGPLMSGPGDTTYLCAGCEKPIAVGLDEQQIRENILRCWSCGTRNLVR